MGQFPADRGNRFIFFAHLADSWQMEIFGPIAGNREPLLPDGLGHGWSTDAGPLPDGNHPIAI